MKSDSLNFFEKLEEKTNESNLSSAECFVKFVNEIDDIKIKN